MGGALGVGDCGRREADRDETLIGATYSWLHGGSWSGDGVDEASTKFVVSGLGTSAGVVCEGERHLGICVSTR